VHLYSQGLIASPALQQDREKGGSEAEKDRCQSGGQNQGMSLTRGDGATSNTKKMRRAVPTLTPSQRQHAVTSLQ